MDFFENLDQTTLRLSVFLAVFLTMAVLERLLPKRDLRAAVAKRWLTNFSITVIASLLVRAMAHLTVPIAAVAAAIYAGTQNIGLFNLLSFPTWMETIIIIIVLDFAVWLQHLIFHKWQPLWRLHQMHHSDIDIDVTTAIRFHPIEIAISMVWKIIWVLALGASALAVIIFEVILNGCAMFNHANVALPGWLDRILRTVIVTPDMHRVHHSIIRREHDSNYGFNLSIWDRLFHTYRAQPEGGHQKMVIGLKPYQSEAPTRLGWSLLIPFKPFKRD